MIRPSLKTLAVLLTSGGLFGVALLVAVKVVALPVILQSSIVVAGLMLSVLLLWAAIASQMRRERRTAHRAIIKAVDRELSELRSHLNLSEVTSLMERFEGNAVARASSNLSEVTSLMERFEGNAVARASAAEKAAVEATQGVRRVQNMLTKYGNMDAVLDRLNASERRTLGSLEALRYSHAAQVETAGVKIEKLESIMSDHAAAIESVIADNDFRVERAQQTGTEAIRLLEELQKREQSVPDQLTRLTETLTSIESSTTDLTRRPVGASSEELREAAEEIAQAIERAIGAESARAVKEIRRVNTVLNDRLQRLVKREGIDTVRQVEALLQLLSRIDTQSRRYPATGGWALAADSLLYLTDLILDKHPKRILEVGSGASTIWLATFAQQCGAKYVSLEHDENFAEQTRKWIQDYGLEETVDLRHAPLGSTIVDGSEYQWYDEDAFADIGGDFDLLIVDGPPEATGEFARFPALTILRERLSDNAVIVLDDIHRHDESKTLDTWLDSLDGYKILEAGLTRAGILVPNGW